MMWRAANALLALGLLAAPVALGGTTLRLAAPNMVADTGLAQALADDFMQRHKDALVAVAGASTEVVLDQARAARADVVLLPTALAQEYLVTPGLAARSTIVLAYDYAVFGPPHDPLRLGRETELAAALARLARGQGAFLAPAPQSAAAMRLAQLWRETGIDPRWVGYERTGASPNATLRQAAQLGAYTIADMPTYLTLRAALRGALAPLVRDFPELHTTLSAIVLSDKHVPGIDQSMGDRFLDYLVSAEAQSLIETFGAQQFSAQPYTAGAHLDPALRLHRAADRLRQNTRLLNGLMVALALLSVIAALAIGFAYRMRRAERARRETEERFNLAVSGTSDAIWDWNLESGEVYFSSRWKEMLGYVGYDGEIGSSIEDWERRLHAEDRELVLSQLRSYLDGRSHYFSSEHRVRTKRGEYLWVLERGRVLWNRDGKPVRMSGSVTDITGRRLQTAQMEHHALHDVATELPNRSLFLDRLDQALRNAERRKEALAVCMLNIDRFHEVNARVGREAGDRALRALAERMAESMRRADTLARLGGDEFGALLAGSDPEQTLRPIGRLLAAIEMPLTIEGQTFNLRASVGVAHYPAHGVEASVLLQHAHIAMYSAKRQAAPYVVYDPDAAGTNIRP